MSKDAEEVIKHILSDFDDVLRVQCASGNWNSDAYMHGMANGMLLMKSVITGECPEYLEKPEDGYLEDIEAKYKSILKPEDIANARISPVECS